MLDQWAQLPLYYLINDNYLFSKFPYYYFHFIKNILIILQLDKHIIQST